MALVKEIRNTFIRQLALKASCNRNALMLQEGFREKDLLSNSHFYHDFLSLSKSSEVLRKSRLTLDTLNKAHVALSPENTNLVLIRDKHVFIGKKNRADRHDGIKPEELDTVMTQWLQGNNLILTSSNCINKLIASYFMLLNIHPYLDGNGRLARAYICGKHKPANTPALILFIQFVKRRFHNQLVREAYSLDF